MLRRIRRFLSVGLLIAAALLVVTFLTGTLALRGSLPRLDGEVALAGLQHPVTITRDTLGVPDISAGSRVDAARALGYLHGQDRFFQMDLMRRGAAGELAALLGPALLETDRDVRRHRFTARAGAVLAVAGPEEKALLEAYAAGVNTGLEDLRVRPPEYLVLRTRPRPWRPEDTILTIHAMFLDMNYVTVPTERSRASVRDKLPTPLADFLLPRGSSWEAPLQDGPVPGVVIPDSAEVDVRGWSYGGMTYQDYRAVADSLAGQENLPSPDNLPNQDKVGSNNWAVAGTRTAHGGALVANDMHMSLGLPNTWYRARMSWPDGQGRRSVVGVTLPGAPILIAGSNGQLAWGFTNSYGDWSDLVILETDSTDTSRYLTPAGWRRTETVAEVITVKGAAPDTIQVEETIWGPVWGTDSKGRRLALRWTAHDTEAVNVNLHRLESVANVEDAVALAGSCGIPPMNLVCGDGDGRVAWALAGRIPRRVGWDGRLPVSWSDGSCRWDGYRTTDEQPALVDPSEGLLWTANNRVAAGRYLEVIGDGGYGPGLRARQIRDRLRALDHPAEKDMLAVQLDDAALYQEQWRRLAIAVLENRDLQPGSDRDLFLQTVRDHWEGRAGVESVSYRLVSAFTSHCSGLLYDFLTVKCRQTDPEFRLNFLPHRDAVTWAVLADRPAHLLPPWFDDWDDLVLKAVDETMEGVALSGLPLEQYTWGQRNLVRVAHPLVQALPQLERWLAAPPRSLPGDALMPRVQGRRFGASDRLVVSPGREGLGILHMPGGQSGHPLSPYFLRGHEDWVTGKPTPLLPGPAVHTLVLALPGKQG